MSSCGKDLGKGAVTHFLSLLLGRQDRPRAPTSWPIKCLVQAGKVDSTADLIMERGTTVPCDSDERAHVEGRVGWESGLTRTALPPTFRAVSISPFVAWVPRQLRVASIPWVSLASRCTPQNGSTERQFMVILVSKWGDSVQALHPLSQFRHF